VLDTLISSKTRIKLLLKFFLNPDNRAYLRGLEAEFGESTNAIRLELNKLEGAGMLSSETEGNRKIYHANKKHPLFDGIQGLLRKYVGIDQLIENIINRLGNLHEVYLVGDLGKGHDSPVIELVFVGDIDKGYLTDLIRKGEKLIQKKVSYVQFSPPEFESGKAEILKGACLLLWNRHQAEKKA
jgi:hypothetical protein